MGQNLKERSQNKAPSKIWELGPAWLTAIAALITALGAAGFFVGRASAPNSVGSAPTTAPPPGAAGNPVAASASSPRSSQPASSPSTAAVPASGPGSLIEHYGIDVSEEYGINLKAQPPPPKPGSVLYGSFDLELLYTDTTSVSTGDSSAYFTVLANQTSATFAACSSDTQYINYGITVSQGDVFCYYGHDFIAGVVVTKQTNAYDHFDITVWRSGQ
jgi:hypothetical protein